MPTTPMKNNLYRLGLILFAPSVATQQVLFRYREDETLPLSPDYGPGRLFKRHHMLGGTLLLDDGKQWTQICSSLKTAPKRVVTPATVFRAAFHYQNGHRRVRAAFGGKGPAAPGRPYL